MFGSRQFTLSNTLRSFLIWAAIVVVPLAHAAAQDLPGPKRVGDETALSFESTAFEGSRVPGRAEKAWSQEIYVPGASYIVPHFSHFNLPAKAELVIRTPDSSRTATFTGRGKMLGGKPMKELWGTHMPGDTAIVEVYSEHPLGRGLVQIDRIAHGYPAEVGEKSLDLPWERQTDTKTLGFDNTWNAQWFQGDPMYASAKAVARLLVNGTTACTGWLVGSEGHLMTNQHCLENASDAANTNYEFMAEGSWGQDCSSFMACPGTVVANSATLIQNNATYDFALVKLPTNPTGTYGYLQLRDTGAVQSEQIYIPQHPGGGGKKIAARSDLDPNGYCDVLATCTISITSPCATGFTCDISPGSSGSPVIGSDHHCVVSLAQGEITSGGETILHVGIPIEDIIDELGENLPADSLCSGSDASLLGQWTFEPGEETLDHTGNWGPLQVIGANVADGKLDLDSTNTWAYAQDYRGPTIRSKTLVSWAALDSLTVSSGSMLTIDSVSEDNFDAIVYAERQPYRWMAGSNGFRRTQDAVTQDETAVGQTLQLAVSYEDLGGDNVRITLCRDGVQIGQYTSANMTQWVAGNAEVIFGKRHTSGALMPGEVDAKIEEARIYGKAMTCAEVGVLRPTPRLLGKWAFEPTEELVEETGNWGPVTTVGATVADGKLDLSSGTWAYSTSYTGPTIHSKTLVSWAALEDLNVTHGATLSIDSITWDNFDAIVYAERQPYRWMAGSSYFSRTQDVVTFDETAVGEMHQLGISYEDLGDDNVRITLCRDGLQIGQYTSTYMSQWTAGNAEALFGVRATIGGTAFGWLDAKLDEARIYGGAMSCAEVGELRANLRGENLALNKPSQASSVWYDPDKFSEVYANDGTYPPLGWSEYTFFHSEGGAAYTQWWEVDLQDTYPIATINVLPPSACGGGCGPRIHGAKVEVRSATDQILWSYTIDDSWEEGDPMISVRVPYIQGSKVRIWNSGNAGGFLMLGEVEVFADSRYLSQE